MIKIVNVIDIEASGFKGYPIQIGGISIDQRKFNEYIIPDQSWIDTLEWDLDSQDIHGIEIKSLYEKGKDVSIVANNLNAFFKDEDVFVHSTFDIYWLNVLFETVGIKKTFKIFVIFDVCPDDFSIYWDIAFHKIKQTTLLKQHDALDDAIMIQRAFTYIADRI